MLSLDLRKTGTALILDIHGDEAQTTDPRKLDRQLFEKNVSLLRHPQHEKASEREREKEIEGIDRDSFKV